MITAKREGNFDFQYDPYTPFSDDLPRAQLELVNALQQVTKMLKEENEGIQSEEDELLEVPSKHQLNVPFKPEPLVLGNIKGIAKELLELQERAQYAQNHPPVVRKGLSADESQRLVERLYDRDRKARDRVEAQKMQKLEQDIAENQRPQTLMNETSARMLRGVKLKDFLERQEERQVQREEKIKQQRRQIEQERKIEEDKAARTISRQRNDQRSHEQFIRDNETWMNHRQQHQQRIHFEVLAREAETLTFRPQINKNSQTIVQKKLKAPMRLEDRLLYYEQRKRDRSLTPHREFRDFTPRINEKSRMLASRSKARLDTSYFDQQNQQKPAALPRTKSQINKGRVQFMI